MFTQCNLPWLKFALISSKWDGSLDGVLILPIFWHLAPLFRRSCGWVSYANRINEPTGSNEQISDETVTLYSRICDVVLKIRFPLHHSGCTPCIQIYYPVQEFMLSKWFWRRVGPTGIRYRVDWQGSTKASYTLPTSGESKKTSSTVLGQAASSTATLVPSYQPTHNHIPGSSYLHFVPCSIIPLTLKSPN